MSLWLWEDDPAANGTCERAFLTLSRDHSDGVLRKGHGGHVIRVVWGELGTHLPGE